MKKVRMPRKEGGKVEGAKAEVRADRKPRKADGGSLGERIMNAVPLSEQNCRLWACDSSPAKTCGRTPGTKRGT
jgi:hypothetical protein